MSFREMSAWGVIAVLGVVSALYTAAVVQQARTGTAYATDIAGTVGWAAVAVIVLMVAAHIVFAIGTRGRASVSSRPERRGASGVVLSGGTVLAIALLLTDPGGFWAANVLILALVASEIATAASQIADERRVAHRA